MIKDPSFILNYTRDHIEVNIVVYQYLLVKLIYLDDKIELDIAFIIR